MTRTSPKSTVGQRVRTPTVVGHDADTDGRRRPAGLVPEQQGDQVVRRRLLAGDPRGGVQPGRQAHGRPQQRGRRLAARRRAVDPGGQADRGVPEQERVPGRHRLRAPGRRHARRTPQAVAAQVAKFNALEPVKSETIGPIPSPRTARRCRSSCRSTRATAAGRPSATRSPTCAQVATDRPDGLSMHITGPVGYAADSSEAFSGIDGKLLYSAMAVVIVILLLTYRSPVLWLIPVISAGTALFVAQAVIYFLAKDDTLTVNAQSSGILTVIVFGAGTDYALLLVARYREELRRHEDRHEAMAFALHRAGPAILASGATVIAGMLCLALRDDELDQGPRPGRRHRRRRRPARHADPAARAARRLRPLDLLAGAPDLRLGRPHPRRLLGAHRPPHRQGPAPHLGRHVASCWPSRRSASSSSTPPASRTRTPTTARPSRSWGSRSSPALPGRHRLTRHGARQRRPGRGGEDQALEGVDGVVHRRRPGHQGRPVAHPWPPSPTPPTPTPRPTPSTGSATTIATVPGADAIAGGDTATRADTLRASSDDNVRIIPLILGVVLLILDPAAARDHRAADPRRDRRAVLRRGDGPVGADLPARARLRRGGLVAAALRLRLPRRARASTTTSS